MTKENIKQNLKKVVKALETAKKQEPNPELIYKEVIAEKDKTIKYLMKTIEKLSGLIK